MTTMQDTIVTAARAALTARIEWEEQADWADGACHRRYLAALRDTHVRPAGRNGVECWTPAAVRLRSCGDP